MAATLKLEIVTPDAKIYSEDVEMVTLPGVEGEMGIYPQHTPLLTQIAAGAVVVRKTGQDTFMAVSEGFAEITGDHVTILADMASREESIEEVKVEEARRRAEARLTEKLESEDVTRVEAAIAYSAAQ